MLNVLVTDDSMIIRRNITNMLKQLGLNVIAEAKTGKEAIELYEKHNPDFVTMDITMPEMTGVEALKEIKKSYKDAKVIMVTSHGQEELVMDSIKSGAKGYILKPITVEKLISSIKKIFPEVQLNSLEVA